MQNNKTPFFYVLSSDKTWDFDQSECVQGPIYILNLNTSCALKTSSVECWSIPYYKITKLLRALSLVDKCVYMRVCKHSCDVLDLCIF